MNKALAILMALTLLLGLAPGALAQSDGVKVIFQMDDEPERLDPTMNDYATGSFALQSLFRGLYKFAEDGTIVPALAEGHAVSEDGTVYTFTLKEGLKWSDGSPLTAHDFEYAWKRVLDPQFASETAYVLYNVVKNGRECFVDGTVAVDDLPIRAVDDTTLEVELYAPTPYFISMTAASVFMPVKKDVIDAHGQDWEWNAEAYVCSGPFRIRELKRDERFIFEKNPNYYNADEVQIDVLEYVFLSASETALLAFENGDVDIAVSVNADAMNKYKGTDTLMQTPRIGFRWYEFRCDKEPFNDPRVRKALGMALDREVLTNAVMQTYETPLLGFIPEAFPDIVDPSKSWREVHGNAFEEDVDAAKALLAEAGYPDGEGFPSFRLIQVPDATLERVAQAMAQMWKQNLGIDAEIVTVESGIYWADDTGTRKSGDFEVCYMGYTGDFLDPYSILSTFYSRDPSNIVLQWNHAPFDDLMEELATGISGEAREAVLAEAEMIMADEMPVIPIYNYVANALVSDRIGGFTRNYIGHPNFEYAYVK